MVSLSVRPPCRWNLPNRPTNLLIFLWTMRVVYVKVGTLHPPQATKGVYLGLPFVFRIMILSPWQGRSCHGLT